MACGLGAQRCGIALVLFFCECVDHGVCETLYWAHAAGAILLSGGDTVVDEPFDFLGFGALGMAFVF